jgi:hypothetical protein
MAVKYSASQLDKAGLPSDQVAIQEEQDSSGAFARVYVSS